MPAGPTLRQKRAPRHWRNSRNGRNRCSASASSSSTLRLAALPISTRLAPETAAPVLLNLVANGSVEEQKAAFRALTYSRLPSADTLLAQQLKLLDAGKVAPAIQLDLLNAA